METVERNGRIMYKTFDGYLFFDKETAEWYERRHSGQYQQTTATEKSTTEEDDDEDEYEEGYKSFLKTTMNIAIFNALNN